MRPTHLDAAYKYELSPKQREVLHLIARGRTNAEIAAELGISLDGAKYHVREILGKLEVESREEAAAKWRAMHSPAARMRALGGLLWHNFVWRAVAAVGVAGGLTSVIVVVLLARDGGPGLPAEATVVAPTSTATVASPTPSPRAAALLPDCTSAQAKLAVELIPAGDDVLIRMSVDGNQPCQLLGPASLRLLHPPTDPGPKYPPFANMERLLKIGLELPFSGVLGEWAWSNWCAPASAQIWDARAGAAGQYLEAQVSVDAFPKCVADGAPTVVHDPQRLSHVADSSAPSSICDKTTALWLCEVITNLNFDVASEGFAALERSLGSNETYYLCDGQGTAPGLGASDLCKGAPVNESRLGYSFTPADGARTIVSPDVLADLMSPAFPAAASPAPYLAAVGCATSSPQCGSFVVVFATGQQPAYAYFEMRLEPGREPALIGAGLVGAASNPIVAGGDAVTGFGPTTFFPLPRPE